MLPKQPNINQPGVFRMNLGTEPPTLDPMEVTDLVSITVLYQTMKGLVEFGPHQTIQPACAQSWTVSPDGKTYVFHLRREAQWSDGKPVTADDFIYAWHRVLDPAHGAPYAYLLFSIQNAEAFYQGKIKDFNQVGVHKLDDYTLKVELNKPYAFFLQIMAFVTALPMREDVIQHWPTTFTEADHVVTNGPYTLSEWVHDDYLFLQPNPRFWRGAPPNHGVIMVMIPEPNTSLMMYESGELDFVETSSSLPVKEVRRLNQRSDFHQNGLMGISYVGFNVTKPPFNNPLVRQAFAESVDKSAFPKIFQSGQTPINSFITDNLFGYNPTVGLSFNPVKALKALKKEGYQSGGQQLPKLEMVYANTSPENRQIAEILQYQWQKHLGVDVQLTNVEWKVFLKQLDDDPPQIFRLQWYVDYPDADSFISLFHHTNGNNHTRWSDPAFDHWVEAAATELNPSRRQQLYDSAQKRLLEEGIAIVPLFAMGKSYLLSPKVEGFFLDELNVVNLERVSVAP